MSAFPQPPSRKDMTQDVREDGSDDGRLMSDRIASEIRNAVLSGEMRPGMRVRQELLAAHFGASRIPVREALKQLENEGLVVLAPNRGAWIADVNQPIYGPTESHFDAWVGYQRKLSDKIDWRVQFNVRSVGEKSKLVTAAVEPDGSVAQQRIMSGATYDFSMKFMF